MSEPHPHHRRAAFVTALIFSFLTLGFIGRSEAQGLVPSDDEWGIVAWNPSESFTSEEIEEYRQRARRGRALSIVGLIVGLAFYVVFLIGPLSPWLWRTISRWVERLGEHSIFRWRLFASLGGALARVFGADWSTSLLFTLAYLGFGTALGLPFWIAAEALDQDAGLSRYTTLEWIVDLAKGELISWVGMSIMVFGLFGLMRRFARFWWLLVGVPAALLLVVQGLLAPYETRIYHRVEPLHDAALSVELRSLARSEGFELSSIRVIEASRTTARLDARILGVGPTRELLLFDTLLDAVEPRAVAVAVAHELGHERRRFTITRQAIAGLALIALLFLISIVIRGASKRLGFRGPGDVRALPLVMLTASLLFLAVRPARLALSRHEERLADRAALTMTADPDSFIGLQITLATANQSDLEPSPLEVFWFSSHPTAVERVGSAIWYRRWTRERREKRDRQQAPLPSEPGQGAPRGDP